MTKVTAALIPREGFAHAVTTLDQLVETIDDDIPLVVVEAGAPTAFRRHVDEVATRRPLTRLGSDHYIVPNAARNLAFAAVDTDLVVFVDNDLVLEPGWLEPLVRCAENPDVWAVGPLNLQPPRDEPTVHFATSHCEVLELDGRRVFVNEHHHPNEELDHVLRSVRRGPTDLVEFHCVLVRSDALRTIGPFDEELLSTLEECDFSLAIRAAGGQAWVEPDSRVLVSRSYDRANLLLGLMRWSRARNRRSARHFARKHDLADPLAHHPTLRYSNRRRYQVFRDTTGLPAPFALLADPLSLLAEHRNRRARRRSHRTDLRRGT